jgi:hypothetical protein
MTAAVFALVGTLVGVLGTLVVELARNRTQDKRSRREALKLASADFTAAVTRMINLALEFRDPDESRINLMYETHRDARVCYERLRLIAISKNVQEAGRYVLRYTFGLLCEAENLPRRDDERERGPRLLLNDWLMTFYVEVRREIGIPQPENIYREPETWLGRSHRRSSEKGAASTTTTGPGNDASLADQVDD